MTADKTSSASLGPTSGYSGTAKVSPSAHPTFKITPQVLSPEVVDRAITVATVFGRPSDFAEFKHDFTGEEGQVQRAGVAIRALLSGRSLRGEDQPARLAQLARSIVSTITSSLASNIRDWPDQLFEEKRYPQRGLVHGRMTAEYVAAGLCFLDVMADSKAVSLASGVRKEDIGAIVDLMTAALVLRGKSPRPVFGRPLSFVRVIASHSIDSWDGYGWTKAHPVFSVEASEEALTEHYASRARLGQAALASLVQSAVNILRAVAPDALGHLAMDSQILSFPVDQTLDGSRIGYPFTRRYSMSGHDAGRPTTIEQTLAAKTHEVLADANRLGGHRFDQAHIHRQIERLILEGFVDTPHGRARAVDAVREVVGAYVNGLDRLHRSLRHRDPRGKADAKRLSRELDELLASLAAGPLAGDIASRTLPSWQGPPPLR